MVIASYSPLSDEINDSIPGTIGTDFDSEGAVFGDTVIPVSSSDLQLVESEELLNSRSGPTIDSSFQSVRPVGVYLPYLSTFLLFSTCIVLFFTDGSDCSQPLSDWILAYTGRHVFKAILYERRARMVLLGQELPSYFVFLLGVVDLSGGLVWTLGGYYIFHSSACDAGLFTYACVLWGLQSVGLLLPCCFLSTILFCAPCLLWLAPYIIRPNPNTVATAREVLSKLSAVSYGAVSDRDKDTSCSICLSDYIAEDQVIKLPCNHMFHSGCIESWLSVSQLCPVDRRNVADLVNSVVEEV